MFFGWVVCLRIRSPGKLFPDGDGIYKPLNYDTKAKCAWIKAHRPEGVALSPGTKRMLQISGVPESTIAGKVIYLIKFYNKFKSSVGTPDFGKPSKAYGGVAFSEEEELEVLIGKKVEQYPDL